MSPSIFKRVKARLKEPVANRIDSEASASPQARRAPSPVPSIRHSQVTSSSLMPEVHPLASARESPSPSQEINVVRITPRITVNSASAALESLTPQPSKQSIWDEAYEALRLQDETLIRSYENIISKELQTDEAQAKQNTPSGETDKTDPNLIQANFVDRRHQMKIVIERGLKRMDEKSVKYTIAGHEYLVRDQVAATANFALRVKEIVDFAIKASSVASMVWAGVCLILPVLTGHSAAAAATSSGFIYVTNRMSFYMGLEELLLPQNVGDDRFLGDLKDMIVELYKSILEFQFKVILWVYNKWLARVVKDLAGSKSWDSLLTGIKELEAAVDTKSGLVNTVASRRVLESLDNHARDSLKHTESLLEAVTQMQKSVQEIAGNTATSLSLPTCEDARWDSQRVKDEPRCHPKTRTSIIDSITRWVDDNDTTANIFWICGSMGTGKSSIARTMASLFDDKGRFAGGYFFKKGEASRNRTDRIFPTLAAQMVMRFPEMRASIQKYLKNLEGELTKRPLLTQFKSLISGPVQNLRDTITENHLIVLDALDECEPEKDKHIWQILTFLSKVKIGTKFSFRVLVTSRTTTPIENTFEDLKDWGNDYRVLRLNTEYSQETAQDIALVLKQSFARIKKRHHVSQTPWPADEVINRLIRMATDPTPLFIYVATVCLFVGESTRERTPKQQLKLWLQQASQNASQLDKMYEPIFRDFISLDNNAGLEEGVKEALQIIVVVVLLITPLSIRSLGAILEADEDDVGYWLRKYFNAVLEIPSDNSIPVRLLHRSFSDYLLSELGGPRMSCQFDRLATHKLLFTKCMKRMMGGSGLRKDICDLKDPATLLDEIDSQVIRENIPPDLEYACLCWTQHLIQSGTLLVDGDETCSFLSEHLLHWLEVISLLRKIEEGLRCLKALQGLCEASPDLGYSWRAVLKDALKIIRTVGRGMELAPLQIYVSGLIFSPTSNLVRQIYWDQRFDIISSVSGIQDTWDDSLIRVLENNPTTIRDLCFSPHEYNKLVVVYYDNTIRIWDTNDGSFKDLNGHKSRVFKVAFCAKDNKLLLSVSLDGTVIKWDIITGAIKDTINCKPDRDSEETVGTVAIYLASSHDLVMAMTTRNTSAKEPEDTLWIWDSTTHRRLDGHSERVLDLALSRGSVLASASLDTTIKLWSVTTGQEMRTIRCHSKQVNSVVFAPGDGTVLASCSTDQTVCLSNAETGETLRVLRCESAVKAIAMPSIQSKDIAAFVEGVGILRWDISTGMAKKSVKLPTLLTTFQYSNKGNILSIASLPPIIHLWDMSREDPQSPSSRDDLFSDLDLKPDNFHFSPSGEFAIAPSQDGALLLWKRSADGYAPTKKLNEHSSVVHTTVFSPDSGRFFSASIGQEIKLWDIHSGECVGSRPILGADTFYFLAVSYSKNTQLAFRLDNAILVLDFAGETCTTVFDIGEDSTRDAAFSPKDETTLALSHKHNVLILNTKDNKTIMSLTHSHSVRGVVFLQSDRPLVASSVADNTIRLWDLNTHSQIQIIAESIPSSLHINQAGQLVANRKNHSNGCINFWARDVTDGDKISTMEARDHVWVEVEGYWMLKDGERAIWLPTEYYPSWRAIHGDTVALTNATFDNVVFLRFQVG